ncbi:TetR/AcrR family transcriptional regulator [Isoptericola sp. NEAU-Y5]|uniref:TetR/AcrR family transcriptional regulator n=1 Tax=Isoptericola luteus TaxID=2879484 RepID=A0ABS7ZIN3_9MICO|nr:TetR/AcrR family transcriptional regulator [Isoptericola sp. NEAU-Y5]MCA5893469.1 TetR/AcrR family transcriptional regulator [Isoptericola sp. NEAU-Y5]
MTPSPTPGRRAAPLSPDDRRSAIVEAVLPLVGERGIDVTSRELADAAGVAEGTIFRAFGDKHTLVGAVAVEGLHRASGPDATRAELAAIDRGQPLEARLTQVIELGRHRMADVVRWMSVLRLLHHRAGARDQVPGKDVQDFRVSLMEQRELQRQATIDGLGAVLAPDAHRLRVPVDVAVAMLEASIAGTHGRVDHLVPAPDAAVIADALVHGIARTEEKEQDRRAAVPENHHRATPRPTRPEES